MPAALAPAEAEPAVTQVASIAPMSEAPAPVPAAATPAVAAISAPASSPVTTPAIPQGQTVMAMNNPADAPKPAADAGTTAAQRLAAQMGTLPPAATAVSTTSDPGDGAGSTDPVLITKIQRGLASLGFLGAKIDGVPGEGTAKAIRNFEVFYDYKVTGLASPQLLNLLVQHGAVI